MDLYGKLRAGKAGLSSSPPTTRSANGDIHSGTGLNHILKDFVVRNQACWVKDGPCTSPAGIHGLPIEWKVEENFAKTGRDDIAKDVLGAECRKFAGMAEHPARTDQAVGPDRRLQAPLPP
jgi:isoleucyl-tRNA synthetase